MFNTLFTGKVFHQLEEVTSTNDWMTSRLSTKPAEGSVVIADMQTQGKGQSGNQWLTEPGQNLTLSILFYPRFLSPSEVFYLNKIVSCALQSVFSRFLPEAEVAVKWPNDLLVNRKKVAGVLTENQFGGNQIKSSVIGIGINVNQTVFPDAGYGRATSLALETGSAVPREKVLAAVLEAIEAEYLGLKAGRKDVLNRKYLQNLYAYQEKAQFVVEGEEKTGIINGVDASGRLAVQFEQKLSYFQIKEIEFCW